MGTSVPCSGAQFVNRLCSIRAIDGTDYNGMDVGRGNPYLEARFIKGGKMEDAVSMPLRAPDRTGSVPRRGDGETARQIESKEEK